MKRCNVLFLLMIIMNSNLLFGSEKNEAESKNSLSKKLPNFVLDDNIPGSVLYLATRLEDGSPVRGRLDLNQIPCLNETIQSEQALSQSPNRLSSRSTSQQSLNASEQSNSSPVKPISSPNKNFHYHFNLK